VAFTGRLSQRRNFIDAAKAAGAQHLFCTSIQRSADFVMPEVTERALATEGYPTASGLTYSILHNGYCFE
jgi:NAD(P)H dehydrogenase (quinone)